MTWTDWYLHPKTILGYAPSYSPEISFGENGGSKIKTSFRNTQLYEMINEVDWQVRPYGKFSAGSKARVYGKLVDAAGNGLMYKTVTLQPLGIQQETIDLGIFDFEYDVVGDVTLWVEFTGDSQYESSQSGEMDIYVDKQGTSYWFDWFQRNLMRYWWLAAIAVGGVVVLLVLKK